jgi:hypothetical protein
MHLRPAQVVEEGAVGAASIFEGVGQDGQARPVERADGELAVVVGGLGQPGNETVVPRHPPRINETAAKGVAEDVTHEVGLGGLFRRRLGK